MCLPALDPCLQTMKELKLSISTSDYVSEEDIRVIAIQAPGLPSYTLVHYLKKQLCWDFRHTGEFYRPAAMPGPDCEIFNYSMAVERVQCLLLPNRDEQECWVRDAPDVDYWMVLTGPGLEMFDIHLIIEKIGAIPQIFYTVLYPWKTSGKKGKNALAFGLFQEFYIEMDERGLLQSFE